ncbi:MAG: cell division protein FtsX [Paracoccaceae bacterium]
MLRLSLGGAGPPIVPVSGWSAPLTTLAAIAMSFLAVLTLTAGVAADRLAAEWRSDLQGLATVRVNAEPELVDTRLAQALDVLATTPGIGAARPLEPAEERALLEPWLGDLAGFEALPAPRLIDLTLEGVGPDGARLQARLDQAAPGAVYDDHQAWRGPLAEAAATLERLAWLATALIVVAAAGMIALAARATLAGNTEVVRIVRLIGGEDRFIANAFVARLALRGLAGGLIGTVAGVFAIGALPSAAGETLLATSLVPDPVGRLAMLFGVPAASALIAWTTARASIRVALAQTV